MEADIRAVLANPDAPDEQALVSAICDERAAIVVACLAPEGTFAQVVAALSAKMPYLAAGWERHVERLMVLLTNKKWRSMKFTQTWTSLPGAVGVLRNQTNDLLALYQRKQIARWKHNHLAILMGPSDAAAEILGNSPSRRWIGQTIRLWGMSTNMSTNWKALVDDRYLTKLCRRADASAAFPECVDGAVCPDVLFVYFNLIFDLLAGWSPDHLSIRRRIAWLEHYDAPYVVPMSVLASLSNSDASDALAEAVCARISREPTAVSAIAERVPWHRLHPRIRECIGDKEWDERRLNVGFVKVWDPDVPLVELQARAYADLIRRRQTDVDDVAALIALLETLPRERRARFEQVIEEWGGA